jgi:ketosteroid isomerase-like protein
MRLFLIVLVASTAAGCATRSKTPAADDNRAAEEAVGAVTDSISAAVGRKDVPRLGQLLMDAQYIGSGLLIPPGRFAEMAGPAFKELATIHQVWTSRTVRVLTPEVALMTGTAETTSQDLAGKATVQRGLYTMVFVRGAAGEWRLTSLHKTTQPAP